jgi:hypothetical protein
MTAKLLPWGADAEVYGEAAGLALNGRVLDLVVTHCRNGKFDWEVVDVSEVIAHGITAKASDARREAENAGLRALLSVID